MSRSKSSILISGKSTPIGVADLGRQALLRVLGPWATSACGIERRALGVSSVVTLQPAAVVYREEQYFDWRIYSFIALGEMLTGLGLARGRVWSFEFGLGLALGLVLLMIVIIFLLHMTTEVTPTRASESGSAGSPPIGASCRSTRFVPWKSSPTGRSPTTVSGEFDPAETASEP